MSDLIQKETLEDILEFEIFDEEIKNQIVNDKDKNRKISQWIGSNVGKGHLNAVKKCNVEYIDYDKIDFDSMDEFEIKQIKKIIKKNEFECPNHINCQMFQNNILKRGMNCPMEMAECYFQTNKLLKELQIKPEDTNDQILLSQLVGLNLIYNRGISGLSNAPLVTEVKKVMNNSVTYDTKVNEHFNVVKSTLASIETLRKSLLLNRDDKLKIKKVKEEKTLDNVKNTTNQMIKEREEAFDLAEIVNEVQSEETKVSEDELKKYKETDNNEISNDIEDIDA